MVLKKINVSVGRFLSIHFLYPVAEQAAVQAYEALLGQLAYEGGNVFVLHVGIGVELRAGGRIGGIAVINEKAQLVGRFAVVLMALTVNHESLGGLEMTVGHEGHLHLILYVLHTHAVAKAQVVHNVLQRNAVHRFGHRGESLENGALYLFKRKSLCSPIALGDEKIVCAHG